MTSRQDIEHQFLTDAGWGDAARQPIAGDASGRLYHRLKKNGATAILMNAPPPQENVRSFVAIDQYLCAKGYSAPKIFAGDAAAGFLLLEDFGDESFTRILARDASAETENTLYSTAIDVLLDLHTQPLPDDVATYDETRLAHDAALFVETWVSQHHTDAGYLETAGRTFHDAWRAAWRHATELPHALSLRDYHAGNLMWLGNRPDLRRVGLLDFQDALAAPVAYDLVSLLNDARRDVSPRTERAMIERYLSVRGDIGEDAFRAGYAVLGAQRGIRIAGVFTRLARRDGKSQYLAYLPRVWRQIETHLAHPALEHVRQWMDDYAPSHLRCND